MDSRGAPVLTDFVLDASAALVLVIDDEPEEPVMPIVTALGQGAPVVPALWRFEVANALETSRRRGRVDDAGLAQALGLLEGLDPVYDDKPAAVGVLLAVARAHRITAYDAAYLALALRRGLPMATTDDRLRKAADAAGVALVC